MERLKNNRITEFQIFFVVGGGGDHASQEGLTFPGNTVHQAPYIQ